MLAYVAMERPGFEADRLRVILQPWPEGEPRVLTADWDRSVGGVTWSPDGEKIGRNDPCYCGSGKKYKRCHGAN